MRVRKSTLGDMDTIMDIIAMAQRDMASIGLVQWQDGYPQREKILNDIELGISFVLTDDKDTPIATSAITFAHEEDYKAIEDGSWNNDGEYCVMHRVAIGSTNKGKGLTAMLVDFAENLCKEQNVAYLRMDTHEDNSPMRRFLAKHAFNYCGVIYIDGIKSFANKRVAYDKKIV